MLSTATLPNRQTPSTLIAEEGLDKLAAGLLLISIFAYEPKILFLSAMVNLARIAVFGFGRKMQALEVLGATSILSSITIFALLQHLGGLSIYLYYIPIYPLLIHIVMQKVRLGRRELSLVCIFALAYRSPDLVYLLKLIANDPLLARVYLNDNQFGEEGVFSLNRLFAATFLAFITLSYLDSPKLFRYIYGLLGVIFFVFISSRISALGLMLGIMIKLSVRKAVVLGAILVFGTLLMSSFFFEIEAISRIGTLLQGSEKRVDLVGAAQHCIKGWADIFLGVNECLRFSGITDLDSLLSDFYFRGGIFLLGLFLFGYACLAVLVFRVNGFPPSVFCAFAVFLALSNYDSSLSKPEYWGPIYLLMLMTIGRGTDMKTSKN